MMSIVCLDLCSLLSLVLYTVSLDPSQIQVYPENGSTSGVFIAMPKNKKYSFNATIAREVCESLSAHIATRAEVQLANHNGLQTCRYGWVKEQIAVIPRTEKNEKCGQNKVGVITWAASPNTSFDVFCFSLTGQTATVEVNIPKTTDPTAKSPRAKTTTPSLIVSTPLNKNFLPPSQSALSFSPAFTTPTTSTFLLPAFSSLPTRSPPSRPHTVHQRSSSSMTISSTVLSSHPFTHTSSLTSSHSKTKDPTHLPPPPRSVFGEVPIACVTIAVILLMATASGICYFKTKRPWVRIHKDMTETEMWKRADLQYSNQAHIYSDQMILQAEESP